MMRWMGSILREIFGLFVDDGKLATVVLAWIAIVALSLARIFGRGHWTGPVFFMGIALILIESVLRFANRSPPE
jgi:hypothetical protein